MSEQTLRYHLKFGVDEFEHASPAQLQYCVDRIARLESALRDCHIECSHLNHSRREYHEAGEPCPVERRINALLTVPETKAKPPTMAQCSMSNRPICGYYPHCECGQSVANQGGKHGP